MSSEPLLVHSEYRGVETYEGHRCHVVHYSQDDPGPASGATFRIWLAEERNLLPVRFVVSGAQGGTASEGSVTEWSEVKPGVWCPKRATFKVWEFAAKGGEQRTPDAQREWVVSVQGELVVESVRLAPDQPVAFYEGIFPKGAVVVDEDQPPPEPRGYRPTPLPTPAGRKVRISSVAWRLILAAAWLLAAGALYVLWRLFGRTRGGEEKS